MALVEEVVVSYEDEDRLLSLAEAPPTVPSLPAYEHSVLATRRGGR